MRKNKYSLTDGMDFVKGEFLSIASYWLDTTLRTVAAGTYTDSTGTIKT